MEILAWIEGECLGKDSASMLQLSMAHFDTILANNTIARLDGLHWWSKICHRLNPPALPASKQHPFPLSPTSTHLRLPNNFSSLKDSALLLTQWSPWWFFGCGNSGSSNQIPETRRSWFGVCCRGSSLLPSGHVAPCRDPACRSHHSFHLRMERRKEKLLVKNNSVPAPVN